MGQSDELRTLRSRVAELQSVLDRVNRNRPDGQAAMTGRVFNNGSMPSTVPAFFAVHPCDIGGVEAENEDVSVNVSTGVVYFLVLGPDVPEVGDVLFADSCGGRWVAEHQVEEETPPFSGCGTKLYAFRMGCPLGTPAQPVLGCYTLREGSATAGQDDIQSLTFTGNITGGTFRLTWSGQTTAAISYDASILTLAANVLAGLEALSNIAPGDVVVGPWGQNSLSVQFTGTYAGTDVAAMTVFSNSLTGTATPTVTVATIVDGSATRNELQALWFGSGITGGTFRLTFAGQTTANISWSSTLATLVSNIDTALEALSTVGSGNLLVNATTTDYPSSGDVGQVRIQFQQNPFFPGPLGMSDQPQITVADNSLTGSTTRLPLAGLTITLKRGGTTVSTGTTDSNGVISLGVDGLPGLYTIDVAGGDSANYFARVAAPIRSPLCHSNTPIESQFLEPRLVPLTVTSQTGTFQMVGTAGDAIGYDSGIVTVSGTVGSNGTPVTIQVPGLNTQGGTASNQYTVTITPTGLPTHTTTGFPQPDGVGFTACGGIVTFIY